LYKMVSTRSSTTNTSKVVVYPESNALRRFSMRLNNLLKAQDLQQQQQQQKHTYNLRVRPSIVGHYNLRPRRHVNYAE